MPDLPEIVYHYSGVRGTLGIIGSMVLWANDWRRLSDTSEFAYPARSWGGLWIG
jgi:hypothetical protein